MNNRLTSIYNDLTQQYSSIARPILNGLFDDSVEVERPKVLFPPNEGASFDAQVAESGFLQRNCAVISAYRQRNPDNTRRYKKDNVASSRQLEEDLNAQGLSYFLLDGCFREKAEKKASHETSFFVYDNGKHFGEAFFASLYFRIAFPQEEEILNSRQ
jgi:hypothetical protein